MDMERLVAAAVRGYGVLEDVLAVRDELLAALRAAREDLAGVAQRQTQPS